jgi:Dolichyl-phosphate-mannose-protein mannosyltransferase
MAGEAGVQAFVHALESRWTKLIRGALTLAAIGAISLIFILAQFRGLSDANGMDHAQIGREIARGNGFSTKIIRPAAVALLKNNEKKFDVRQLPELYHAPLNPLFNAGLLALAKGTWTPDSEATIYEPDRIIVASAMAVFLIAVLINYFIARRLFDQRLAFTAMVLVLVCDMFWQFSRSGLPQMLMLLIFSCCNYCLLRAIEARVDGGSSLAWSLPCAALFGFLALAHSLTIWLFAGVVLYAAIFLRPRVLIVIVMLLVFLAIYSPLPIRNYMVSGNPLGLGVYAALVDIKGSETTIARATDLNFRDVPPGAFRAKIQSEIVTQISKLFGYLGMSIVAPVFFVSLLHVFRRPATSAFRWSVLLMWFFALLGMSVFGLGEGWLDPNNLHVLFIPVMTFYGLAFVLVLWSRLQIQAGALRAALLVLIVLLSAMPLINTLMSGRFQVKVHWPPYLPAVIARFHTWVSGNEVLATDMPSGVAWYADRLAVYLPQKPEELVQMHDFRTLGLPLAGIYLTPVTGNMRFISEIAKGEYKSWGLLIMRGSPPKGFAFSAAVPLPFEGESVFYSDRPRWQTADQQAR